MLRSLQKHSLGSYYTVCRKQPPLGLRQDALLLIVLEFSICHVCIHLSTIKVDYVVPEWDLCCPLPSYFLLHWARFTSIR